MKIIKPPKLDLSKPNCHVCGKPLLRNTENQTERCINFACSAKDVNFHIPYDQKVDK